MKSALAPLLLLLAATATAKPLIVANDAWRATALADLAPMLRACVPKPDQSSPPNLPLYKADSADLDTKQLIQDPASLGRGYWYRIGWRAKDGTVYVVAQRSPDGQRTVYGPVNETWACLPAEVRKRAFQQMMTPQAAALRVLTTPEGAVFRSGAALRWNTND